MSSPNIIKSHMFEAFFKLFTYHKGNRSDPKTESCEHHSWYSLTLCFLFYQFEWIVSYLRGSSWAIHDFCPLYHIVPNFGEEWSGLTVSKAFDRLMNTPSVYICYFQEIQWFEYSWMTVLKTKLLRISNIIFDQVFVQTIIY